MNPIIDAIESILDDAAQDSDAARIDHVRDALADLGLAAMQLALVIRQREAKNWAVANANAKGYHAIMDSVRGRVARREAMGPCIPMVFRLYHQWRNEAAESTLALGTDAATYDDYSDWSDDGLDAIAEDIATDAVTYADRDGGVVL